jgi:acetyltransferase
VKRALAASVPAAMSAYPKEWERHETLANGMRVFIRPLIPDDAALYPEFFTQVTEEDTRLRFFSPIRELSAATIQKFVEIDYERVMAFAALDEATGKLLGVSRLHCDRFHKHGEYAVLVRSDLKGRGLGWLLMQRIIDWARGTGLERIHGQVLAYNTTMLGMCAELRFESPTTPMSTTSRWSRCTSKRLKRAPQIPANMPIRMRKNGPRRGFVLGGSIMRLTIAAIALLAAATGALAQQPPTFATTKVEAPTTSISSATSSISRYSSSRPRRDRHRPDQRQPPGAGLQRRSRKSPRRRSAM